MSVGIYQNLIIEFEFSNLKKNWQTRKLWDQTLNIVTLDGDRKIESNHASSTITQGHCSVTEKLCFLL